MRRLKWLLLLSIALCALYGLVGSLLLPKVLRDVLQAKLSAALRRPVTVAKVRVQPFRLAVDLRTLRVAEPGGGAAFLSLDRLLVDVSLESVWKRGLVVDELRVEGPYVRLVRRPDGAYNLSDLLTPGRPEAERKRGVAPKFALGNVRISGGAADLIDEERGETHTLREFALTLPFASNFPAYVESFLQPAVSGKANGSAFSLGGRSKPFADSLETSAEVRLSDLDLPRYARYLPADWSARLTSGRLDLALAASYVQRRQGSPSLSLSGTVGLKEAAVEDRTGRPVVRLPLAEAVFGPVEVFSRSARVSRLRLDAPELDLVRARSGTLNVLTLVPPAKPDPEGEEPSKFSYRIDELLVSGGRLRFADEQRSFRTTLAPVEVAVRGLSNAPGEKAQASLSTKTEAGESFAAAAVVALEPFETAGNLQLQGLDLAKYQPFYRERLRLAGAGRLGVETRFVVRRGPDGVGFSLSGLAARLRELRLRQPGERSELLSLASLEVDGGQVDSSSRRATLARVALSHGDLGLRRNTGGTWNVQEIGVGNPPARRPAAAAPTPRKKGERPWAFSVTSLSTKGFKVAVEDRSTPVAVRLGVTSLNIDAADLSTAGGKRGRLAASFRLNRNGEVSLRGPLALQPFSTSLNVGLKNAEIAPFQPYFAEQLRALVTSGAVGAEGVLTLGPSEGKSVAASFRGGAQVSDFSCVDKETDADLLRFGALAFRGVDYRSFPPALEVEGISLTDYETSATLEADGTLNLTEAFGPRTVASRSAATRVVASTPQGAQPARTNAAPPMKVEVRTITLQGGQVTFKDRQVTPAYTTTLADLGGRISGLSSQEATLAGVDLRGKMDGYAPLAITGQIQPLRRELFVDLKAAFEGADLTAATPYSGKYVGYEIEKGKLSFDVRYKIQGRKLDSQNVVVLDQFTFGEAVESPTATKLPVRLGIALLKDRKGEIRLDLPVSGSLDDPQFSVGRIVWKMVVNLLTKAVTSPFALIGSLFGGEDDLGSLEFAPGSSELTDASLKKLQVLSKALTERPALRLEIAGSSDGERDPAPLQRQFLERKLKARKAQALASEGTEPGPLEKLTLTPEERPVYVALAYGAESFPKPATARGAEKELNPEEMEKLLLAHIQIAEDDLQLLADYRAAAVRDVLLRADPARTQRIFTTRTAASKVTDGRTACRVDFRLKE